MHILYVCKTLPYAFKGGIQTHVWELSKWMIQRGHKVSLLTSGSWQRGHKIKHIGGRTIYELPYLPGRKLPLIPILAEEFSFNLSASRWLRKNANEFDIIHLQGRSGYLFPAKNRKTEPPVITTLHGLIDVEYAKAKEKVSTPIDRFLHRNSTVWFEKRQLKYSDKLIAVSNEMQEILKQRRADFGNKTEVIYNGIDIPVFQDKNIPADPHLLLFVGRLTALKGIFPLVEAMSLVDPLVKLVMIGDGPSRGKLEILIKERGLDHRIKLLGSLPSEKVYEWIRKCYALVLPSFYETQGIVLMEANICGKPVLATDIAGIKEVVIQGKNGYLFPPNSSKGIAEAVNRMFSEPLAAQEMGQWGKNYIYEKFAWEKIAAQTELVYQSVAS